MGYYEDKAAETQAAVDNGNPEQAAAAVVHAMFEGGTDPATALAKLTAELNRQRRP